MFHTPEGVSDELASTLPVAGLTAAAALSAIALRAGDTVLIGGAAGGVGIFAVQLAKLAGAQVIGTVSESTFEFLRQLGAEPVEYGPGLADRVRALVPGGVTAATDLIGTETAEAGLALGIPPDRISTIAAGPTPPGGVRATGGAEADPADMERITKAIYDLLPAELCGSPGVRAGIGPRSRPSRAPLRGQQGRPSRWLTLPFRSRVGPVRLLLCDDEVSSA